MYNGRVPFVDVVPCQPPKDTIWGCGPMPCHVGTAIDFKVKAENEEEAEKLFWKALSQTDRIWFWR